MDNYARIEFIAKSSNESFARVTAAAFTAQLDPTLDQLQDIKTAVSEAVTNAVIHGYPHEKGMVIMCLYIVDRTVCITIEDFGVGIADIEKARQPLYTGMPGMERSGMGFTVMENFMDTVDVFSLVGFGTKITMTKEIGV